MKILFLIDSMTSGGKERRLTELMKKLSTCQGIEFNLAVMSRDIHYQEVFDLNITIHYVLRKRKKDFSVFRILYRLCKESKPDIVHCWDGMTAVYIAPVCKILNIKLVNGMVVDTPVHFKILNKSWLRAQLTFPFSDLIIGNSKAGLKAYNAPGSRSVCIHNGMHLSRFDDLKEPDRMLKEIFGDESGCDFVVGMVAAFEDRKDYETLIKAAAILLSSYENMRFIFVGDGVNFNKIKDNIPISLRDSLFFLGRRSDVESIVNIFDIGVLLTNSRVHGEGISNAILEYMALSKPVIATVGGGTNEVVSDHINGYLIDAQDINQLVEKIGILKNNNQLRIELGQNGKKLIQEKFNINVMAQNYVDQYNILVNKS
jgi:glycosyltransferase involved in cell wall biosynthesis